MEILVKGIAVVFFLFVIVSLAIVIGEKIQLRKYYHNFWNRQSITTLNQSGILSLKDVLEPFNFMHEIAAIESALKTISLSLEYGLFEILKKNPGVSDDILMAELGISKQAWRAVAQVLLAADVIVSYADGYELSKRAQIFLMDDSPFLEHLPPPFFARKILKKLKRSSMNRTILNWEKGKSIKAERVSLEQHRYSFPIGFEIQKLGLLQNAKNILDVAGGAGSVCVALALMNPVLDCQLIELPHVTKIANKMFEKYNVLDRIKCLKMDMFVGNWPSEMDAVLFTNIFHDWDDNKCQLLAQKAYDALNPGGLILIQEALLNDDKPGPLWTAHWSMTMALEMQGRQFKKGELVTLLEAVGFSDIQVHPLFGYFSSIIGIKST